MNLKEIGVNMRNWIDSAQDINNWRIFDTEFYGSISHGVSVTNIYDTYILYCLRYFVLTLFSTVVPSNSCMFLSCRPFVVNTTFSTRLVGVEVIGA